MLQISGVLEVRSHQLRRHALKTINATICGTATTEFWQLMESYFGVDEDEDEAALEDTQSLVDILAERKAWATEKVPSVPKESAKESDTGSSTSRQAPQESPDVIIDDDEEDDNASAASVHTTQSTASAGSGIALKTLAAKKKATVTKYPNMCSLKEATLFYPTSDTTLHMTGLTLTSLLTERKLDRTRVTTVVPGKIVLMQLRPTVSWQHMFIECTSVTLCPAASVRRLRGGRQDIGPTTWTRTTQTSPNTKLSLCPKESRQRR